MIPNQGCCAAAPGSATPGAAVRLTATSSSPTTPTCCSHEAALPASQWCTGIDPGNRTNKQASKQTHTHAHAQTNKQGVRSPHRWLRTAASARPPLDYGHSKGYSRVLYRYLGLTLSTSGPLRALTCVRPRRRVEDAEFVRERHDRRRRRRLGLRRRKENEKRTKGERDSSSAPRRVRGRVRFSVRVCVSVSV